MYRSRPKPNGCAGFAARRARRPPISSRAWLAESATECTDSASTELDPVSRNATNLVTAIPMLALSANIGIAVTKFVAFLLTGSSSMLAESVHSVADSANQALLLIGGRRARREANPAHPFGFGRERYIYSFIVAIVLFSVGGLFALYEAWQKWQEAHGIESWHWVPVVVLLAAIVMEGLSFRTAVRESNRVRGEQSWVSFVRNAKAPELPVILLEDLGALFGLGFALFGVGLTLITGNGRWDAAGTACIGVLLVVIAFT